MTDDSAKVLCQPFQQEALVSSSEMGRDVRFFVVVHPAFPLADYGATHPSRCFEGWFWRGCRGE